MNSGRIAAAWFDSMEPGMLDEGRPLHAIETLQVSPRVASTTRESRLRSAWAVAKRLDEVLSYTPVAPREFVTTVPGVSLDLEAGPSLP
jgi:phosphoglycerate dehydrogenase-like enzyme